MKYQPAFPLSTVMDPESKKSGYSSMVETHGMTLLDYFAAKAMVILENRSSHPEAIARHAYEIASAMLEVRKKYLEETPTSEEKKGDPE